MAIKIKYTHKDKGAEMVCKSCGKHNDSDNSDIYKALAAKCSILIAVFLLYGCASIPPLDTNKFNADFPQGKIVLDCDSTSCSFESGYNERELREMYEQGRWMDLAQLVSTIKHNGALHYFYLGKAAYNLGYRIAAKEYFRRGRTARYNGIIFSKAFDKEIALIDAQILAEKKRVEEEKLAAEARALAKREAQEAAAARELAAKQAEEHRLWLLTPEGVKYLAMQAEEELRAKAMRAKEEQRARAEQARYAVAQYNLGNKYFHGKGVPKDLNKAVDFYQKAAAQGHTSAHNALRSIRINQLTGDLQEKHNRANNRKRLACGLNVNCSNRTDVLNKMKNAWLMIRKSGNAEALAYEDACFNAYQRIKSLHPQSPVGAIAGPQLSACNAGLQYVK